MRKLVKEENLMINRCVMVLCLAFSARRPRRRSPYFIDIGVLPGDANSEAMGINNNGQVVGTSWVGAIGYTTDTAWMYDGTIHAISGGFLLRLRHQCQRDGRGFDGRYGPQPAEPSRNGKRVPV